MQQIVRRDSFVYMVYCDVPTFATTGINKEELIFRVGKYVKPEVISRIAKSKPMSFDAAKRNYSYKTIIDCVKTGRISVAENGNYVLILK